MIRTDEASYLAAASEPVTRPGLWTRSRALRRFTLVLLALCCWQAAALLIHNDVFPTVPAFLAAAAQDLPTAQLWQSVGATLAGWSLGLLVAAVIAVPAGLLIGLSTTLDVATRISISFLQAIPSIVLLPLTVLVLGATLPMKVVLVAIAATWPLLMHAIYGVREVDHVAKETAHSYHLGRHLRALFLYLPSAGAFVATGLRISATIGLMVGIAAEVLSSTPGIGEQILLRGSNGADPASAFVYFVAAALLGMTISVVFRRIERAALFWHPSQRNRREA
ncbi:ABC transporter permease [Kutzneria sp. NPDC052558]|uniref:ABC transporter permease n=1 Tax=Kutzneria sp. NPDC052558 TaxID=3364121 RepID=UPI0037C74305